MSWERPVRPRPGRQRARQGDEDLPKEYENANGCLTPAKENPMGDRWTELLAPRPGTYRPAAPYRIPRGTPCPDGLR